ncbi:MAG TPA: hypothetical protein VGD56_11015 [Gemmatirosa sp.]
MLLRSSSLSIRRLVALVVAAVATVSAGACADGAVPTAPRVQVSRAPSAERAQGAASTGAVARGASGAEATGVATTGSGATGSGAAGSKQTPIWW